jgi:hypothetical protein
MYLRALDNGLVDPDPGVEFFSIAKLPTIVTVGNSCIHEYMHACSPIKNSGINLPVDVARNITNLPMEVASMVYKRLLRSRIIQLTQY